VLTGGKAIFKDLGVQLDATTDPQGCAGSHGGRGQVSRPGQEVRIDAENTTITEGKGDAKAIEGRAELIRKEIDKTDSEYDREKLQERLAKLAGGVAVLKVGGATETAMKERKALYEDSLHATRAAIAEGIVPGGGVALLNARKVLDRSKLEGDEAEGIRVLYRALEMPTRLIAENAGLDGTVVVSKILKGKDKNFGYNADTEEYEDLRKAGVIDPVKVTRSAIAERRERLSVKNQQSLCIGHISAVESADFVVLGSSKFRVLLPQIGFNLLQGLQKRQDRDVSPGNSRTVISSILIPIEGKRFARNQPGAQCLQRLPPPLHVFKKERRFEPLVKTPLFSFISFSFFPICVHRDRAFVQFRKSSNLHAGWMVGVEGTYARQSERQRFNSRNGPKLLATLAPLALLNRKRY